MPSVALKGMEACDDMASTKWRRGESAGAQLGSRQSMAERSVSDSSSNTASALQRVSDGAVEASPTRRNKAINDSGEL